MIIPIGLMMNDLLKYAVENGIIDMRVIAEEAAMRKKEAILKDRHTSKISQGNDGRWKTRVPTADGKTRLIAKQTKPELLDFLCEFYEAEVETVADTFQKTFQKFRDFKSINVSDNTIYKYDADYRRFFSGTDFEKKDIRKIDEEELTRFIVGRIKALQLNKRAYEAFWSYLYMVFKYAKKKRIVEENPMDYMERRDYARHCVQKRIDPRKRIISADEMVKLREQIECSYDEKPKYIPAYALDLARLTGMRVGELAALTWDSVDWDEGVIIVDKAEIYHQATHEYTISKTKNGSVRAVPITPEIRQLLETVRRVEERNGFLCEWVFANGHGKINKNAITKCAVTKSHQAQVDVKSVHCYRRTVNSKLKSAGVSTTTAAAILGHTEDVNDNFYTYDVSDLEYKRKMLSEL